MHDLFTMIPTLDGAHSKDGIAVDVSSMQYERTVRSHKTSLYHDTMTQRQNRPLPFGTSFKKHCVDLEYERGSVDNELAVLLEAQLRTTNRAVYRETQRLGGRQYLLDMWHSDFICALDLDSIEWDLCGDINSLRPRIEPIAFQKCPWASLQQLMNDCEGEGSKRMMKALHQRLGNGM